MPITKQQALNFANKNKQKYAGPSANNENSKYFYWGALHLLIQNDVITPAQLMVEFPEFA